MISLNESHAVPPQTDLFETLLEAQSKDEVRNTILAELPLGRLE